MFWTNSSVKPLDLKARFPIDNPGRIAPLGHIYGVEHLDACGFQTFKQRLFGGVDHLDRDDAIIGIFAAEGGHTEDIAVLLGDFFSDSGQHAFFFGHIQGQAQPFFAASQDLHEGLEDVGLGDDADQLVLF